MHKRGAAWRLTDNPAFQASSPLPTGDGACIRQSCDESSDSTSEGGREKRVRIRGEETWSDAAALR